MHAHQTCLLGRATTNVGGPASTSSSPACSSSTSSLLRPATAPNWPPARPWHGVLAHSTNSRRSASSAAAEQRKEEFQAKARVAAKGAQSKLRDLYEQAQESAGRTWVQLDSSFNLKGRAERAGKRAEEALRDVDQTWNVRRNIRKSVEYVQRKWPIWQRNLDDFATTWYGKATVLLALCLVISSPIFWRLLNFVLLLWWLAIPAAAVLMNMAQKQAVERMQQQAEEQRARQANPFADIFNASARGSRGGSKSTRARQDDDGPVIDADYEVVDKK